MYLLAHPSCSVVDWSAFNPESRVGAKAADFFHEWEIEYLAIKMLNMKFEFFLIRICHEGLLLNALKMKGC